MRKTLSCLGYSYKYLLEKKNVGAKELFKLLGKRTITTDKTEQNQMGNEAPLKQQSLIVC